MRRMRSMSGDIRFVRSYPLAKFWTCSKLRTDATRLKCMVDERYIFCIHALLCGVSGSRAVCPAVLMRSASCRYMHPVYICWCPFDLTFKRSATGQVTEFPGRIPHAHSVIVQRTFFRFLYGTCTYSFCALYILYPYVSWLFFFRYLFLYVCAPFDFRVDIRRHWDDFHHRINIFAFFSVR